jgi:FMN phosphatase YigB (HAD superfamily)
MGDTTVAVSVDMFGTLVTAERPANPATAIATELTARDVPVPHNWEDVYTTAHVSVEEGQEISLSRHVTAALVATVDDITPAIRETVDDAVTAAFDCRVTTRDGATDLLDAFGTDTPVGILSNCSVSGLVDRTLERSALDASRFDAIVTSVECGWRKPDPRAFETVAAELGVEIDALFHVGDDPETDGGVDAVGGQFLSIQDHDLGEIPAVLGRRQTEVSGER